MAEDADGGQKSEEPTGRKLSQARNRGEVAQSREVSTWFMLTAGTGVIMFLAGPMATAIRNALVGFLDPGRFLGAQGLRWDVVGDAAGRVAVTLVTPMLIFVAAAIAASLVQTGFMFATEKLSFDISHISPLKGMKRMFSVRSSIELVKSIVKIGVVSAVAISLMRPELDRLPGIIRTPAEALPHELYREVLRLLLGVLVMVTVVAATDYFYQRFAFMRSMRMTKQEIKEEHRQSEGDPTVKMRLRQLRYERARKRMMAAVPKASVVITNPTHFAVALQYEMGAAGAPKVVAKGADLVALRIREIATEHGVPIVENPPLARALYAGVDIDREIPAEHYKAVAEVIGYVFRLKGKMKS